MSRDGLLQAIADSPEDDSVRLVFADWLEESGDELDRHHAELIRVQIARERLPLDDDGRAELEAREQQLRYQQFAINKRLQCPSCVQWRLSRGFPDRVGFDWNDPRKGRLTEDDLAQMADAVHRWPIRTFAGDLLGCAGDGPSSRLPAAGKSGLELLASWPALARLTALEATCGLQPYEDRGNFTPGLLALAQSPYAGELRRLRLGGWQVDPESLKKIASSPCVARLRELHFGGHPYGPDCTSTVDALGILLGTPLSGRLERLICIWVDVPANTIRDWLDKAPLQGLAFGVPEGEAGVGPLLGSSGLTRLGELHITGEEHGFDVDEMPDNDDRRVIPHLAEFLASAGLAGLEKLSMQGVALGDDGVRALAGSPAARSLVELDLTVCGLTGEGLRSLRPLLAEGRLRRLSIDHNELTRADAEDMASWPEFRRVYRLEVGFFNYMEDEGRKALAESPHRHPWLRVD